MGRPSLCLKHEYLEKLSGPGLTPEDINPAPGECKKEAVFAPPDLPSAPHQMVFPSLYEYLIQLYTYLGGKMAFIYFY